MSANDLRAAIASLPVGPWSVDDNEPFMLLDANGATMLTAERDVVANIAALRNGAEAVLRELDALKAALHRAEATQAAPATPLDFPPSQSFRTEEDVAPYLPAGARMPNLPTFGIQLKLWIMSEMERLRDPEEWERKRKISEKMDALAKADAEQRKRREAMERRQDWIDRAISRGCFAHKPTIDAILAPRETPAMKAVKDALRWRREHSSGHVSQGSVIVLSGRNGAGKTVAASWLVASRGGADDSAIFVRAATIGALPTSDYSEYIDARKRYVDAEFLAIDECGDEQAKHAGLRVGSLVRERYDAGRFTVITTNLDESTFAARYFSMRTGEGKDARLVVDERIKSRILDEQKKSGLPAWIDLPADSYRGTT